MTKHVADLAYALEDGEELAELRDVRGMPTSEHTAALARDVGVPLVSLAEARPDLTIDGADEIDPQHHRLPDPRHPRSGAAGGRGQTHPRRPGVLPLHRPGAGGGPRSRRDRTRHGSDPTMTPDSVLCSRRSFSSCSRDPPAILLWTRWKASTS